MPGYLNCGCGTVKIDDKLIIYRYCPGHKEQLFNLEKYGKLEV